MTPDDTPRRGWIMIPADISQDRGLVRAQEQPAEAGDLQEEVDNLRLELEAARAQLAEIGHALGDSSDADLVARAKRVAEEAKRRRDTIHLALSREQAWHAGFRAGATAQREKVARLFDGDDSPMSDTVRSLPLVEPGEDGGEG